MKPYAKFLFATTMLACGAVAGAAQAQEPATGGAALEEIVVTAEKRSTNLQETPISVSVVTASDALRSGISSMRDLNASVPGLTFTSVNGGSLVFLRGVGQAQASIGNESPVAMYIDGVYLFAHLSGVMSFNDIQQIEVLKGPQGTLFGRNATGGVIQIFTKDPQQELAVSGDIGYSSYNTVEGRFYATHGITEDIAGSIAIYGKKRHDGYGKNLYTGNDIYTAEDFSAHGKLKYVSKSGDTSATLNLFYDKTKNFSSQFGIFPGYKGADNVTTYIDYYTVNTRYDSPNETEQSMVSAKLEHDFPFARVVNITGYHDMENHFDASQNPVPGTNINPATGVLGRSLRLLNRQASTTWTNEFQIQALPEQDFQWIVGGFVLDNRSSLVQRVFNNETPAQRNDAYVDTNSIAVFAQATKTVLPNLRFTGGIRYTEDTYSLHGTQNVAPLTPAASGNPTKVTDSKATYRAVVDYRITPELMVFASYNTGFKAGRFAINNFANPPLKPENIVAYELGVKSEFFDRRMRLNVSAYHYDYDNLQLRAAAGNGLPLAINAAEAEVEGVDLELEAVPTERLRISIGAAYFDGQYSKFPGGFCPSYNPVTAAINTNVACDLSGQRLIRAPEWSGSIRAVYELPTSVGDFSFMVSDSYSGSYAFESDGRLTQDAFHKVSASVTWWHPDGKWGLEAFGTNLLDEEIYSSALTNLSFAYVPGDPRILGVRFKFNL